MLKSHRASVRLFSILVVAVTPPIGALASEQGGRDYIDRSPAVSSEFKHNATAIGVTAARVGAGAIIGGAAGKIVAGSPAGVIVGGILSPTPTASPRVDMTHQPGEPPASAKGGGGKSGGGTGEGNPHVREHREGTGSIK